MQKLSGALSWMRAYACAGFHAGERLRHGKRTFPVYVPTHLSSSTWPPPRPHNRPRFQGREAAANPAAKSDTQQLGITLCFSFWGRRAAPKLGPQTDPAPALQTLCVGCPFPGMLALSPANVHTHKNLYAALLRCARAQASQRSCRAPPELSAPGCPRLRNPWGGSVRGIQTDDREDCRSLW